MQRPVQQQQVQRRPSQAQMQMQPAQQQQQRQQQQPQQRQQPQQQQQPQPQQQRPSHAQIQPQPQQQRPSHAQIQPQPQQRPSHAQLQPTPPQPQPPQPAQPQPQPQPERASQPIARPLAIPVGDATASDNAAMLELVRRVALQRDLPNVVGVLSLGASELTAASIAVAVVGADASIWSPRSADLRVAASVVQLEIVAKIARGTQHAVTPRALVIPCGSPTPNGTTVALIAHRPATAPEFEAREAHVLASIAVQVAPIIRGFLIDHANKAAIEAADKGGLFRAEALKQARQGNADGKPIFLTPGWVKWAYPSILALIVALIVAAALIEVPSYSTGSAIVVMGGERVTCPNGGGTVDEVLVTPGQTVTKGDILVRLTASDEQANLRQIDSEWRAAQATFLFDPADPTALAQLSSIAGARDRVLSSVDNRAIRATRDGIVNDVRVHNGDLLIPGAPVLAIVDPDAQPSIIAFLPGSDRPRLGVDMTLQVQLAGYSKSREEAVITEVGAEVIGPTAARKYLGETVGDALPLHANNVIVRAKLPGRTFEAAGKTYEYHDGMTALAEVRVESRSFLKTLVSKE
jgi:hypothetical protein